MQTFPWKSVSSDRCSDHNTFSLTFIIVVRRLVVFLAHWYSELQREKQQKQTGWLCFMENACPSLVGCSWLCCLDYVNPVDILLVNWRRGVGNNEVSLSSLGRLRSPEAFVVPNDGCLPHMLLCGESSLISECERGVGTRAEGICTKCTLFINRNAGMSALIFLI